MKNKALFTRIDNFKKLCPVCDHEIGSHAGSVTTYNKQRLNSIYHFLGTRAHKHVGRVCGSIISKPVWQFCHCSYYADVYNPPNDWRK